MGEPCKSFRRDNTVCADGFPQKPICSGNAGCVTCGAISNKATPFCLSEDLPPHIVDQSGRPRLYRAALTTTEPSA